MVVDLEEYRCEDCGILSEYLELRSFYAPAGKHVDLSGYGLPEKCESCGSPNLVTVIKKTEPTWTPDDDPPLTKPVYLQTDKTELTTEEELSKEAFLRWQNSWDSYQFFHYLEKVDVSLLDKEGTEE